MEIYLITAGALFLFYYGILCFYTGKWNSTFARFWQGRCFSFIMESSVSIPENGTLRLPDSGWWRGLDTF